MSEFKYLKVVTDGTDKFVSKAKEYYRVVTPSAGNKNAVIEPLHGYSASVAAREYCITAKVTSVTVRYATPESNYKQYKQTDLTVDPSLLTQF